MTFFSDPDEPLDESAPLAWAEAPTHCFRDSQTGETCLPYHRVWQYLRLLGIITSVRTNRDFLLERFFGFARSGRYPSVLVSATADYSMLAHLHHAYDRYRGPLQVTVVDRCKTALLLNRYYADRFGVRLDAVQSDLLNYQPDRRFDLVCTHNLLGRFDPTSRMRLVQHWHQLLRPGGCVVTTQRILPHVRRRGNRFTDTEAREFEQRVVAAAELYPGDLGVTSEALGKAAHQYATTKASYLIRSVREVADVFEIAGFDLQLLDEGGGEDERRHDRPSSNSGPDTFRMRIVAVRP